MENYYTKSRVETSEDCDRQFRAVRAAVRRHKPFYLFTENAFQKDLANRGDEVKDIHLNYIRNAMIYGGVKKDKVRPDMVFDFFLSNLPEGKEGEDLMLHWIRWFTS